MKNVVIIQGRFTADPEIKTTANSGQFCSFTLASQRGKNKAGELVTDFAPCMAWGKTADFIANHFSKGQEAIIEGRFQSRNYKGGDGVSHVAYEIYVSTIDFCGPARNTANVAPVAAHCSNKQSIQDEYEAIDWDSIPDLPESF